MDDPLSIWGTDVDASSEAPTSTQPPEPKPLGLDLAEQPPSAPASMLAPSPTPIPTRSDDDEPGWGISSSPPQQDTSLSPITVPPTVPSMPDSPPPSVADVPEPPSGSKPGHAAPHATSAVVETSTEGVSVEATMPYYEQERSSRPSSTSASRRASGHSTPTGFTDKAGLKLSTMTAPPTPDEQLPGNAPNASGPLSVISPGLSPTAPGLATRLVGRSGVPGAPSSAHPVLLHQHLTRLHQQGIEAEDKGKGRAVDAPAPQIEPTGAEADSVSTQPHASPKPREGTTTQTPAESQSPPTQSVDKDGIPDDDGLSDDDGFDDFGEPGEFTEGDADFGDFGDFDEAEAAPAPQPVPTIPVATAKPALQVPSYSREQDATQIATALSRANLLPWLFSIPGPSGAESVDRIAVLGRDGIRQTGGTAQVLGSSGGANSLLDRMKNLPDLPPVAWERSRTRAQHRQSLALPPEVPRPQARRALSVLEDDAPPRSLAASPAPPTRSDSTVLPAKEKESPNEPPAGSHLDRAAARSVLNHTQDSLQLLSLPVLRGLVDSATSLTGAASSELTHWLTVREALAADAETYNTMIRDLVVGASARLGPGAPPPSSRSGGKKGPTMRFTMAAGIPRPQSPSTRSPAGSGPNSRAGTPVGPAGRSASGRGTPSGYR